MIDGSIVLSDTEKLVYLIGDGVSSISKFICLWYEVSNIDGCRIQYSYVEHEDFENAQKYIDEALDKYKHGMIQCSYCGEWIPIKDAHHFAPAGCSCDKCFDKAHRDELDFLSMLD